MQSTGFIFLSVVNIFIKVNALINLKLPLFIINIYSICIGE